MCDEVREIVAEIDLVREETSLLCVWSLPVGGSRYTVRRRRLQGFVVCVCVCVGGPLIKSQLMTWGLYHSCADSLFTHEWITCDEICRRNTQKQSPVWLWFWWDLIDDLILLSPWLSRPAPLVLRWPTKCVKIETAVSLALWMWIMHTDGGAQLCSEVCDKVTWTPLYADMYLHDATQILCFFVYLNFDLFPQKNCHQNKKFFCPF